VDVVLLLAEKIEREADAAIAVRRDGILEIVGSVGKGPGAALMARAYAQPVLPWGEGRLRTEGHDRDHAGFPGGDNFGENVVVAQGGVVVELQVVCEHGGLLWLISSTSISYSRHDCKEVIHQ